MNEQSTGETRKPEGGELHPEHDSWARITTHNSFTGVLISLTLAAVIFLVITLHMGTAALAFMAATGLLMVVGLVWSGTPQYRRGFLGNAAMAAGIKLALATNFGANAIDVCSSKGVVTLRGSVPYPDFSGMAADLARQHGALKVINEITVDAARVSEPASYTAGVPGVTTPEGTIEDPLWLPLEQRVREALQDDPRVDAYVMNVRVEYGIAYLTGRQEMVQASKAATDIAAHVPGVLGVSNDIEIVPSI